MEKAQTNGETITAPVAKPSSKGKKKALEDIYQKKTQLEHILLRPDTYIGLYKIFDEILVNAADHKQRDPKMDTIKIEINQEENLISVWNNGKGIPVSMHKGENMFVPTMIFGHLLTSSNYDDAEEKVTGGRNGYGAKLCNIFSTKFTVETSSQEYKKSFKQAWANNMSKASEPKIKEFSGSESTKISFSPDLSKFKMQSLDDDIVSIMSRRAFDVAASTRGVKVYLNGKKVPVKGFKDYVEHLLKEKEDDMGNPVKCVYEAVNDRWEIAIALSDKGFQQVSFVNSIATTKGGRHVDYITDMIVKNLVECLKKKNKSGVNIKPFQIKNHLWVFVNSLIVNPTFDSQTKENMTLQPKSFGSKCSPSDKFVNAAAKCGIVEAVMTWAKFKQQAQLQSKCASKKQNKIKGIPKLEDANDAGTRYSSDCTLILTEGDSAKTLAVAGLGVVGRDRYGVFPLKGKLLNVREATHTQILENAEINNIIKILGLQYKKKYDSDDDLKTLRYGKLMIMTDQDHDGSHIKGLLINFIHHNWPTLLRRNFLEEFITPIVKATKGKEEYPFYSIPEFFEWKKAKNDWHTYKIKYYKGDFCFFIVLGLGTSTSKEAKEYFQDMVRHRIKFKHEGNQDDHAITMAFSKKAVEQRKEWLTSWMEECKRRKELGLPDIYLYEKNTRSINYTDFVNKELVLFSNLDNERSIPSLVDGLKPGQRKVLFTCLKRNDKKEIKVAQLAGSVAEHSAYHHGEASLMSTIINLAQNFVGSNNINLLKPIGQFGTRLQGGKDAASPRYIFTQLSPLTRFIFHVNDEPVLKFLKDDNQSIEPEWYMPIIPMVLVNGAEGIGTGWSTKVPNFNPREIIANIKRMLNGEDPLPMKPWFKNFRGTIDELDFQRYVVSGEIAKLQHTKYEITELPVRTWTQAYKESVMEPLLQGKEDKNPSKNVSLISDYREYHTDTTVKFVVTVPEDKMDKIENEGPHKVFKLQSMMSLSSMVLFDHNGCLRKYNTVMEMLQEFFDLRLKFYGKRKSYLVGMLEAESNKLSNQARFILEKCDGRLTIENKKKREMIAELQRKGYESDPVKAWKIAHNREALLEEEVDDDADTESDTIDYDYLLGMTMWTLTKEKKDELLKKRDAKVHELETLKVKSPSDLWLDDLNEFLKELDRVEAFEREEGAVDSKKESAAKMMGKKRNKLVLEVLPSPNADRIVPMIDAELKRKAEKAAALKEKGKKGKKPQIEADEFDSLISNDNSKTLTARLGNSPDQIEKAAKEKKKKSVVETGARTPKSKSKVKRKLTSDTTDEESGAEVEPVEVKVEPRERAGGRRAASKKVKYNFDEESEDSELSFHSNEGVEENNCVENITFNDSPTIKEEKKVQKDEIDVSDTDSEFEAKAPPKKKPPPPKSVDKPTASQMFDSLFSSSSSPTINTKLDDEPFGNEIKKFEDSGASSSDSGDEFSKYSSEKTSPVISEFKTSTKTTASKNGLDKKEPAAKPPSKKGPKKTAAAKRKTYSDSDDDYFEAKSKKQQKSEKKDTVDIDEPFYNPPARHSLGRAKKAMTKIKFSDSESDDDY
ncbi:DNA topoisomerase 2 [Armadillidium nasatum]|uniref:DNA topoisomerase 2 n=1 Tax=Armadillidium nasatum TaxID=96803 RepID=A0A5N5SSS9_9CRUS|nr:DNA topoisomerase 2 [Armadillidium nasatum]